MVDIQLSTIIRPHEDPARVVEAVRGLFPDWDPEVVPESSSFPKIQQDFMVEGRCESLDSLVELAREQRILDTALDAISMRLEGDFTVFSVSRQAAMAGKLSFVLEERSLGGEITVRIEMEGLAEWLERITWHPGRDSVPRAIGDGLSMSNRGEPVEWFDKRGNPTIGDD
tara:strand:+ start:3099 stop:3608 length:510 start_codon:yes stop_codon:yes gene_type:complete